MVIDEIKALHRKLENNKSLDSFPDLAFEVMTQFTVSCSLSQFEREVENYLLKNRLPAQLNLFNNFGEPSLTIYNNGFFAIDIYFWRKNDTIVHSHGFRGAFKVLFGNSLQEEFKVDTLGNIDDDIINTKLKRQNSNILLQGQAQMISSELTHRVVHLGQPSVTLCVRTVEEKQLSQWHHLSSGISFKKINLSESDIKSILYFQYLLKSDFLRAKNFLVIFLSRLNKSTLISLYESVFFDSLGLDQLSFDVIQDVFLRLFESAPWFQGYQNHFEKSVTDLQELNASAPELKLLAHFINNDYSLAQSQELIAKISDRSFASICNDLDQDHDIFTPEHKEAQLKKIRQFSNSV